MVYDAARGRVLVFGGTTGATEQEDEDSNYSNELWEFDGLTRRELVPVGAEPDPRTGMGLAYDEARGRPGAALPSASACVAACLVEHRRAVGTGRLRHGPPRVLPVRRALGPPRGSQHSPAGRRSGAPPGSSGCTAASHTAGKVTCAPCMACQPDEPVPPAP